MHDHHFWQHVDVGAPDDCWPWTGATNSSGYGYVAIPDGKTIGVHRYALETRIGEIPAGLYALHSDECTTRRCCNPDHLRPGTQKDNMAHLKKDPADGLTLEAYIRARVRPWPFLGATDEEVRRPSLTAVAREASAASGLTLRRLNHKMSRRANWKASEVLAVAEAIGGDPAVMVELWRAGGDARGKPGNPRGWGQAHSARKKSEKLLPRG